ncbi:MAG: hypothetical protein A2Y33_13370 [Spirochaetes bacterium GWF1_51_8]|nr:MAG: hypothetical protein A2Y33_13370 [Spirochaetes bacterium GWF1_51_8]
MNIRSFAMGVFALIILSGNVYPGVLKKPYDFASGALIKSSDFNSNFNTLYNWANGGIDMENLSMDPRMLWKASGGVMTSKGSYIGIGVINPESPFHLAYSTDNKPSAARFGKGGLELFDSSAKPFLRFASSVFSMSIYPFMGYGLGFRVSPAGTDDLTLPPQMIILTNGRVGIGTTMPGAMLHIKKGSVGPFFVDSYVSAIIEADFNSFLTLLAPSTLQTGIRFGDQYDTKSAYLSYHNFTETLTIGIKNNSCVTIASNGNVGIGSIMPEAKLHVIGDIKITGDLITDTAKYPDFVFEPGYKLPALADVASFIGSYGHLPGMPSAAQVKKDGFLLKEQTRLTLMKLEEAYLYIIQQDKKLSKLLSENEELKKQNSELEKRLDTIEQKLGI